MWLGNYKIHLPTLGPVYGLTEVSILAAMTCINGLLATLTTIGLIRKCLSEWVVVNEELQYDKPVDASVTPQWPPQPTWPALPAPIQVNAWQPILETTRSFLAKSNLSTQDRITLMLNPYVPTQRKAHSAENFNYPLIQLTQQGSFVEVRITRGNRFKGKMVRLVIDYSNSGVYHNLAMSTDKMVLVPIVYPAGVTVMTYSIRAVYMSNGQQVSDWCPAASIVLRNEDPEMAAMQLAADPQALERSVQNMLSAVQTQPQLVVE